MSCKYDIKECVYYRTCNHYRTCNQFCEVFKDNNINVEKAIKQLNIFCDISIERHKIYLLKKHKVEKPWTDDEIFQNYFFCNVFRENDKTSEYIIEKIIKPNEDNPELYKYIILSRYISKLSTLKFMVDKRIMSGAYNEQFVSNTLKFLEGSYMSPFTNAFILNTGIGNGKFTDRITYIIFLIRLLGNVEDQGILSLDKLLINTKSNDEIFAYLKSLPGVGDFMSWQYLQDFHYSKRYMKNATDNDTFIKLGIGAIRGIKHIFGKENYALVKKNLFLFCNLIKNYWRDRFVFRTEIVGNTEPIRINTKFLIKKYWYNFIGANLKLCDVEHWLCEYDKYKRGGSKKRKYNGKK